MSLKLYLVEARHLNHDEVEVEIKQTEVSLKLAVQSMLQNEGPFILKEMFQYLLDPTNPQIFGAIKGILSQLGFVEKKCIPDKTKLTNRFFLIKGDSRQPYFNDREIDILNLTSFEMRELADGKLIVCTTSPKSVLSSSLYAKYCREVGRKRKQQAKNAAAIRKRKKSAEKKKIEKAKQLLKDKGLLRE